MFSSWYFLFLWCFLFIGGSLRFLTPDWILFCKAEHCLVVLIPIATWPVLPLCTTTGPHTHTSFICLPIKPANWDKICRRITLSNIDLNIVFLARDVPHQNNEVFNNFFLIPLLLSWFKNKNACFQMFCSTVPKNTWEYFVVADRVGWRKIKSRWT